MHDTGFMFDAPRVDVGRAARCSGVGRGASGLRPAAVVAGAFRDALGLAARVSRWRAVCVLGWARWSVLACVVCAFGVCVPCASAVTRRLAAIHFSPPRNGFAFPNYGNGGGITNLTVAQMQRLFGSGVCASGQGATCVLSPPAEQWMIAQNQLMADGHCQGLAISSLLFARRTLDPLSYGGRVPKLALARNATLQGLIAYTYAFGALASVEQAAIQAASPTAIVRRLVQVLRAGQEQWVIYIYKANMSGGHAVTPYEVDSLGHDRYGIRIYDNNWPGRVRTITVNGRSDTWSYQATQNPHDKSELYVGNAQTKTLQLWNLTPGLGVQPCPFCTTTPGGAAPGGVTGVTGSTGAAGTTTATAFASRISPASSAANAADIGRVQVVLAGSGGAASRARLLVRGGAGRAVGFTARGRFVDTLPGARAVFATNGGARFWTDPPAPMFELPDTGTYAMSLQGEASSSSAHQALSMIGPGFSSAVEGLSLTKTDENLVTVSGTGAMTFDPVTGSARAARLVLGVAGSGGDDTLTVTPVGLAAGQALGIAADRSTGTLTITPPAHGTVQLSFQVDRENPDGTTDVFASGPVLQVAAGQGDTVADYGAWTGGSAPMTIQQGSNAPQQLPDQPNLAVEPDTNGGFGTIPAAPATAAPVIVASASPSSLPQGASAGDVTITGTGFQPGARAFFSNPGVIVNSMTYVSATELTANVSIAAGATPAAVDVSVSNPDGTAGIGTGIFTIAPGATVTATSPATPPTVTGATPGSGDQGATSLQLTIAGTGFALGARASFSNPGITVNATTFVDSSHLAATISIAPNAAPGAGNVTVSNPDGSAASDQGIFTVDTAPTVTAPSPAAPPTVTGATPGSGDQGASNLRVTIAGTGFASGAQASFSNPGITVNATTFVDSSHLTATISIAPTAALGAGTVTVSNPDGTSATGPGAFTVGPAPAVTGATPAAGGQGTASLQVTIAGTGFEPGGQAAFSNPGVTVNSTSFVDSSHLTASISIAPNAALGAGDVTVTNPDGTTASGHGLFTVDVGPTVTAVNQDASQAGQTLAVGITGTGFEPGAQVTFANPGVTVNSTTFQDASHLAANISIAAGASTGPTSVTVANPDGSAVTFSGSIYWTNSQTGSIGRANTDGSDADQAFITDPGTASSPASIAVYPTTVFWSNLNSPPSKPGTIADAELDGSAVHDGLVASANPQLGLATDGQYLYWTTSGSTIARSAINGAGLNQTFISPADGALTDVAVGGGYIYWVNNAADTIGRASLSNPGATINNTFIVGILGDNIESVAVDASHIYWSNSGAGSIGRADIDGTNPNENWLTTTAPTPYGLSVDSTYIYWADNSANTIGRAPLANPTAANDTFITGASQPYDTAVTAAFTITP
jgi:hypothetical protein